MLFFTLTIPVMVLSACDLARLTGQSPEKPGDKPRLMVAVAEGDAQAVRELLDTGVDVNATHIDRSVIVDGAYPESTALHYAARSWNARTDPVNARDIMRMLIDSGADVNALADSGSTPLQAAVCAVGTNYGWEEDRETDLVEMLIDRGADVNIGNADHLPFPTWIAAISHPYHKDHPDRGKWLVVTEKFIRAGANFHAAAPARSYFFCPACAQSWERGGGSCRQGTWRKAGLPKRVAPLGYASGNHDTELVEMLIDGGANVNFPMDSPPLLWAMTRQHDVLWAHAPRHKQSLKLTEQERKRLKVVELLLASGADPNLGAPLLIVARKPNNDSPAPSPTKYARLLLESGADPSVTTSLGQTALMLAAENGNVPLLDLMIKAGSNPNIQDGDGRTALMMSESEEATKLLLEAGADPNLADSYGKSALFYAVDRERGVQTRLRFFASTKANDGDGEDRVTLMRRAREHVTQGRLLILAGADVNATDDKGRTPLMHAAKSGTAFAELLIDSGADKSIRDKHGKTALEHAWEDASEMRALLFIPPEDGAENASDVADDY